MAYALGGGAGLTPGESGVLGSMGRLESTLMKAVQLGKEDVHWL